MKRYVPVMLIGLVLLVYGRSLVFDFVGFDDGLHVINNPYFHPLTFSHVMQLWSRPYQQVYMPVTYMLLAALAKVGTVTTADQQGVSFNPYVFHLASVVLHGLNVLLVWGILRKVVPSMWGAAVGAAVFAAHPLQVESVAWISSIKDLLGGTFALAALFLWLRFDELWNERTEAARGRAALAAWGLYGAASAAFVLGFLAKATTIVTPAVAIVLVVLRRRSWRWRELGWLVPWFGAAAVLTWSTAHVQSDAALLTWSPLWARPIEAIDAISFYLAKLFWPAHLAVDYGRTPQWVVGHWAAGWVWLAPLVLGGLLWRWRRHWPGGVAGAVIFLAALSPVLGLIPFEYQGYSDVADRYMYLPMLGVALAVGSGLPLLERVWNRRAAALASATAVVALGAVSFVEVGVWRDSASLFAHAAAAAPNSGFGWQGVGLVRQEAGDWDGAVAAYRTALAIRPDDLQAMTHLAGALMHTGPPNEARLAYAAMTREAARRVLLKFPHDAMAHRKMGEAMWVEGDPPAAIDQYRRAIADDPHDALAHFELAQLLEQRGDLVLALNEYRIARRLAPGNPAIAERARRATTRAGGEKL